MAAIQWTEAQEAIIRQLWPDATVEKIASACGVGRTSVYRKALLMGLPPRERERMAPEEIKVIVQLHKAGLGYRRIARKIGRPAPAVRAVVRHLPSAAVTDADTEEMDQAEAVKAHGEACLRAGGFPVARVTPAGTVWEYPAQKVAA